MNNRISYAQQIKEEIKEVQISLYLYIVRVNKIYKEKRKGKEDNTPQFIFSIVFRWGLTKNRTHDC